MPQQPDTKQDLQACPGGPDRAGHLVPLATFTLARRQRSRKTENADSSGPDHSQEVDRNPLSTGVLGWP